jgi:signal transduction histidine kinase
MLDVTSGVAARHLSRFAGRGSVASSPAASIRPDRTTAQRLVAVSIIPIALSSLWLGLTTDHLPYPEIGAVFRTYQTTGFLVVGLLWWVRRPGSRIGPLLVLLGLLAWPITWQASGSPVEFTLGVLFETPAYVLFFYLILAFPADRLASRTERLIIASIALADVAAVSVWALIAPNLQGTDPLLACTPACPPNPFRVEDAQELLSTELLTTLINVDTVVGLVAATSIIVIYVARIAHASRPRRRALLAVGLTSLLILPTFILFHFARVVLTPGPEAMADLGLLFVGVRVLYPLGFALALFQSELFANRARTSFLHELAAGSTPSGWRDVIATTLDDPSLQLGFVEPATDRILRIDGTELVAPVPDSGRFWVPIARDGQPVAAMVTDEALAEEPELVKAASDATLIAVEVGTLEGALRASRARVVQAGDTERRRIGRDLHDSAQQRLVALRIHLSLASDRLDEPDERAAIAGLGLEVEAAIDDLRTVARSAYPPLLEREGIAEALRSACRRSPIPVTVTDLGTERHSPQIENAVYFACLEAIQNAFKHAGAQATVNVWLAESDAWLAFFVEDDGPGFDPATVDRGMGLNNMVERMDAVGGSVSMKAAPKRGTRISGRVPTAIGVGAH